jgi:hypothetical protein
MDCQCTAKTREEMIRAITDSTHVRHRVRFFNKDDEGIDLTLISGDIPSFSDCDDVIRDDFAKIVAFEILDIILEVNILNNEI